MKCIPSGVSIGFSGPQVLGELLRFRDENGFLGPPVAVHCDVDAQGFSSHRRFALCFELVEEVGDIKE